jgi:signal transduction histidine kinase
LIVGERRLSFALAQHSAAVGQFVQRAEALHRGGSAAPLVSSDQGQLQFFDIGEVSAVARFPDGDQAPRFQRVLVRQLRAAGLEAAAERAATRTYLVNSAQMYRVVTQSNMVLGDLGLGAALREAPGGDDAQFQLTVISAPLPDGRWLNSVLRTPQISQALGGRVLAGTALLLAAAIGVTLWLAWLIARPLRRLASACEDLRVGREAAPIPEEGPSDVRHMIAAFNALNDGRARLIDLQRRMIGAIGHDLRTPLTTLRLRAEKIEEPENRERMIAVVEEAQQTIDAVLSFVREGVVPETTRRVDLPALVEALCADYRDLGQDVAFEDGAEGLAVSLRSAQVTRALRNLIENALKYGERARVRILQRPEHAEIQIDDDGPGVPTTHVETVFEPFVRLEDSRNRETGGLGLGLAIARTIARSHGGEVTLKNRPEGGARAVLRIPLTAADQG